MRVVPHPNPTCAHVHDTWARSYLAKPLRGVNHDAAWCAREGHRALRDRLLGRCHVRAVLDPEHVEYVHGYAVWELDGPDLVVHWAYVRSASRRHGIGYALLGDALAYAAYARKVYYTHATWFAKWCDSHELVYRPICEVP